MIAKKTEAPGPDWQTLHQFVTTSQFNPEVLLRRDPVYPRISVVMPSFIDRCIGGLPFISLTVHQRKMIELDEPDQIFCAIA
jgi:hypothetical protein